VGLSTGTALAFVLVGMLCVPGIALATGERISPVDAASITPDLVEPSEILEKYSSTQAKLQRISVKYTAKLDREAKLSPPYSGGKDMVYYEGLLRWDGVRARFQVSRWGDIGGNRTKEEALYNSYLYDGSSMISYGHSPTDDKVTPQGTGFTRTPKRADGAPSPGESVVNTSDDGLFFGYCHDDRERVDKILSKARNLSVKRDGEGYYVISGRPKYGRYTIWLDPSHDFHIVKAEFQRRRGDLYVNGKPLAQGIVMNWECSVDKFEQIQDLWVPIEAHSNYYRSKPNGDYSKWTKHQTRTEIVLNPDFDTQKAFVPDDVRDGALFSRHGVPGNYLWERGKLIPTN